MTIETKVITHFWTWLSAWQPFYHPYITDTYYRFIYHITDMTIFFTPLVVTPL